jgi:hypothetical protein
MPAEVATGIPPRRSVTSDAAATVSHLSACVIPNKPGWGGAFFLSSFSDTIESVGK